MSINQTMRKNMKDHFVLYMFVSVLFLTGIVFGALLVNALSLEQKQEVNAHLASFLQSVDQGSNFATKPTLMTTFSNHVKWLLFIWLLGLSMIGLPIILIINFLKGALVGFAVGYLVAQHSWKGMLFAFVSIAPQNMIIIPSLMIMSVSAIAFSLSLIKSRLVFRKGNLSSLFTTYLLQGFTFILFIFGASLLEIGVTPIMMGWVTPMLVALG